MDYKQPAAEVATKHLTFGAAGGGVFFGLTANEVAAYGSLAVAVLAMILNAAITWHFKSQHLKLAVAKAKADGVEVEGE